MASFAELPMFTGGPDSIEADSDAHHEFMDENMSSTAQRFYGLGTNLDVHDHLQAERME